MTVDLPPARVPAAETPTLAQLLNVVLAAIIVGALYLGRQFLVPLTLAVLLAFVLAPPVRLLRRWRFPRASAVLITVTLSVIGVCGVGALIGTQLAALGEDLPRYQGTIESKFQDVGGLTTGKLAELTGRFGLQAAQAGRQAAKAAGLSSRPQLRAPVNPTLVQIYRPPATPLSVAKLILKPILGPLATTGLVVVLTVFILLQQVDLRDRLIRLVGSGDLHRTTIAMNEAGTRLSRYFLSQLSVNIGFGAAIAAGLALIGVPHAALWGAVAAVMRFIPYLGGLISITLAASMAAAVDPGWSMVAWTVGLFLLVEVLTGQLVEPLLYGHSTGLSPVSIVVAAVFWTWIWGPVGLVLSTPLSLCLVVLGRHVPRLAFIDVLLGDQPALTAVESFYQRVLAEDADELLQQAEAFLATASLAAYYDEVALKGLLLAANDAQRGVLKRDQLSGFKAIVEGLIADVGDALGDRPSRSQSLDAEGEAPADAGTSGRGVLCVGGPGPLDDLGAAMLCQLLGRQGVRTSVVSYLSASRDKMRSIDFADVDLICVFHLSVVRQPTRLQHLLERLQATAALPVIVAIAHSGEAGFVERIESFDVRAVWNLDAAVLACVETVAVDDPPCAGRAAAANA